MPLELTGGRAPRKFIAATGGAEEATNSSAAAAVVLRFLDQALPLATPRAAEAATAADASLLRAPGASVYASLAEDALRAPTAACVAGLSAAGFAALVAAGGGRAALEGKTTAWVKHNVVLPLTAEAKVAFADSLRAGAGAGSGGGGGADADAAAALVGDATVFLSHAYDYFFLDAVDAAAAWEAGAPRAGGGPHFFYFDLAVVNQHGQSAVVPFEVLKREFGRSVARVAHVIFLLDYDAPVSLERAWCVFEAATALASGARFEVVMPPRCAAAFAAALERDFASLVRKTCAVDVARAAAREPADRENIFRVIREDLGGFLRVNQLVVGALRDWMASAGRAALGAIAPAARATSVLQRTLSRLLQDQGDLAGARALMAEARAACAAAAAAPGAGAHAREDALKAAHNLAGLELACGALGEAGALVEEAAEGREELLGADDADALASRLLRARVA